MVDGSLPYLATGRVKPKQPRRYCRLWCEITKRSQISFTFNEETGNYEFGEINWDEFFAVIAGRGQCNHGRIEARRKAWEEGKWVRDSAAVYAQKQQATTQKVA